MRLDWTRDMESYLIELRSKGVPWSKVYKEMNNKFGDHFSQESCRSKYRSLQDNPKAIKDNTDTVKSIDPTKNHKLSIDETKGTGTSEKIIPLDPKDIKNQEELLRLHGLPADIYTIEKHVSSIWQHRNKEHGTVQLYASKLFVKEKQVKLTDSKLIEVITRETKPIKLNTVKYKLKEKWLLEIPFMDMHFGPNTLEDYEKTLLETTEILKSKIWDEVLITFGSDLMHVDNLKNTTANQTRIQDVDHIKMIEDVKAFYEALVKVASKQSNNVKVTYIKGNHDETTSGLLIHWLQGRFQEVNNVTVDYSIEEVKIHPWERVFIALSHGDKGGKRTKNILSTKFPVEWANAKVREFHKGHLHHYIAKDEFGILERTLSTGAKIDQYHKDNSYEGAHKRFMVFEYSEDKLEAIHYV